MELMGIYMSNFWTPKDRGGSFWLLEKVDLWIPKKINFNSKNPHFGEGDGYDSVCFFPVLLTSWILFDQHHIFSPRKVAGISTNGICIFLVFTVSNNLCLSTGPPYINTKPPPSSADTFIRNAVMIHFDLGVGLFTLVSSMEKNTWLSSRKRSLSQPGGKGNSSSKVPWGCGF